MTGADHLPGFAREAHDKMLAAWDHLAAGILAREGPAMKAELLRQGHTDTEATQGAEAHVARIREAMQAHRARLEAEAIAGLH